MLTITNNYKEAIKASKRKLAAKLEEIGYLIKEQNIIPVGATVGAHIGPNACAIAYVKQ